MNPAATLFGIKLRVSTLRVQISTPRTPRPFDTLAAFSRPEAEARIRSLGGVTASSVTKATDFLVTGERPGSKLAKAQRYGTALLTDEEFMALLREHGVA